MDQPPPEAAEESAEDRSESGAKPPPEHLQEAPIRANDRVFLCSSTRSGKSTVAAYLFSQFRCQRVLVDPKAEWRIRGARTVRTPDDLAAELERSATVHFVPARFDRREFEDLYDVLFQEARDRLIWTDELQAVCLDGWAPRALRMLQTQGAAMRLGHIGCGTRPRRMPREILTEADHILVFEKGLAADDAQDIAREMDVSLEELRSLLAELPPFGFLWYQRRSKSLHIADALPAELIRASSRVAYKVL
jgi:hypothetical protein